MANSVLWCECVYSMRIIVRCIRFGFNPLLLNSPIVFFVVVCLYLYSSILSPGLQFLCHLLLCVFVINEFIAIGNRDELHWRTCCFANNSLKLESIAIWWFLFSFVHGCIRLKFNKNKKKINGDTIRLILALDSDISSYNHRLLTEFLNTILVICHCRSHDKFLNFFFLNKSQKGY